MDNTNKIIKFDLHIHSKASEYKEAKGVVDNSTKENLHILFEKLNENHVSLFSITDHNRFDAELYKEIKRILSEEHERYPNVLNVLAGIEFDVKLEDDRDKCHIIAIFDAKYSSDYEKIERVIKENMLEKAGDYYNKEHFEKILKDIRLDVILIVHQKKDIYNSGNSKDSLSDACSNIKEIIELGYINALEFQKPQVEGILLSNLMQLNIPSCSLVSGSDCHNWSVYPPNPNFHHSEAKILPTFKGLLMAVTSPETRFNRIDGGIKSIKSIKINDMDIPLTSGINVIIGENGSGKTSLLEALNGNISKKYIQDLVRKNNILFEEAKASIEKKYISQGKIIHDFYEDRLFESENYLEIDTNIFLSKYKEFSQNLYDAIKKNIKNNTSMISLNDQCIMYEKNENQGNYYIEIINDLVRDKTEGELMKSLQKINSLYAGVCSLLGDSQFMDYEAELSLVKEKISNILEKINKKYDMVKTVNQVINVIHGRIDDYQQKIRSYQDRTTTKYQDFKKKLNSFIKKIIDTIKEVMLPIEWPTPPEPIPGYTSNKKGGFNFNLEAKYNNKNVFSDFIESMLVKNYRDFEKIKKIKTLEELQTAVLDCSKIEDIEKSWKKNYDKFCEKEIKTNKYISEETGEGKIGNTLGEISLVYYKYCTSNYSSWDLLMIDQPEDNISNKNIKDKLISYFDHIRKNEENKQIIFVTHNPLLVVNLDADNVIFLKNNDGVIQCSSGCLEYEDDQTNMLDLIAKNMDGGKDTIERRLKVYGKNY